MLESTVLLMETMKPSDHSAGSIVTSLSFQAFQSTLFHKANLRVLDSSEDPPWVVAMDAFGA